jgi:hypothetical protein
MVDYLYTGNYETLSQDSSGQCENVSAMVLHARIFSLADKYLIDGLRTLSWTKFEEAVRHEQNTCIFLQSVPEIYALQSTLSGILRNIMIESVRERTAWPPLKADVKQSLDGIIDENHEFARDLLKSYSLRPILGHCFNCGNHKIVPISPLQCRCEKCGKGGASTLPVWFEDSSNKANERHVATSDISIFKNKRARTEKSEL